MSDNTQARAIICRVIRDRKTYYRGYLTTPAHTIASTALYESRDLATAAIRVKARLHKYDIIEVHQ